MSTPPLQLILRSHLEGDSRFVVGRHYYNRHTASPLHNHDFSEVFWITRGKCRHILSDGEELLQVGDVRFIRPDDMHSIVQSGAGPMHLTNIAFPADILSDWEKNYPVLAGHFFWVNESRPGGCRIQPERLEEWKEKAHRLSTRTNELLFLHQFLLELFQDELPSAPDAPDLPGWIKNGLAALENREVIKEGVPGFVSACGRSPEHVSRACRKHLGKTPGELVNEARMKDAARQLRMTDQDILNIMYDCGLSNPSHFYKLFKARYGDTPRRYRLNQRILAGR